MLAILTVFENEWALSHGESPFPSSLNESMSLVWVLAFPSVLQDAPRYRVDPDLLGDPAILDVERISKAGSPAFTLKFLIGDFARVRFQRDRAGLGNEFFASVGECWYEAQQSAYDAYRRPEAVSRLHILFNIHLDLSGRARERGPLLSEKTIGRLNEERMS
jgi:hypothetical protein